MTAEVAHKVRMLRWLEGWRVIAVNDVYKLLPYADILYSCDERWWVAHDGAQKFHGERWSSHAVNLSIADDKIACAKRFDLHLVHGTDGEGFSIDQRFINYGGGSGGQAVNLAILKGCRRIVMVGFDGQKVDGRSHFFGEHPAPLANTDDENYKHPVRQYQRAAQLLPDSISIVNATPNSAITAFPMMGLDDACRTAFPRADGRVHCNGAESHARTD